MAEKLLHHCIGLLAHVYVHSLRWLYNCVHTGCGVSLCQHALVHAQFVHELTLGNKGGEVEVVYENTCCLSWGLFLTEGAWEIGVLPVPFVLFDVGGSVCGCMCVCTHARTHTAHGVFGFEPKGRDKTTWGPEESRWTKSRHECIRTCVQSTRVYIYAGRRNEILLFENSRDCQICINIYWAIIGVSNHGCTLENPKSTARVVVFAIRHGKIKAFQIIVHFYCTIIGISCVCLSSSPD